MAIIIKEAALRELVREALDGSAPAQAPGPDDVVKISNVVDPQAAETDPGDPDFRPQDAMELNAAIRYMINTVPSEKAADVYGKVRAAIHDVVGDNYASSSSTENIDDDKEHQTHVKGEGKLAMTRAQNINKIEEIIRRAIRMQLIEQNYGSNVMEADDDDEGDKKNGKKRRGAYKDTALGHMGDEGGNFSKIARELGFSVSGAKQAVDKAIRKAHFVEEKLDKDDLEILILTAMNDYISYLAGGLKSSSKVADVNSDQWDKEMTKYNDEMRDLGIDPNGDNDFSESDIQLMKDHPDIVRTLPGFRDFLHTYIRRAATAMGEKIS